MPSVTLTPMQLPPAAGSADSGTLAATVDAGPERCQLRLSPGEPSELVVQVRNDRDQPLTVANAGAGRLPQPLEPGGPRGQFPTAGATDGWGGAVCHPPDHFERHPLGPGQVLQINYSGQVVLEGRSEDGGSLQWQTTAPFTLVVRPHSLYPVFCPASIVRWTSWDGCWRCFEQTFEPAVQAMDTLWAHLDPPHRSPAIAALFGPLGGVAGATPMAPGGPAAANPSGHGNLPLPGHPQGPQPLPTPLHRPASVRLGYAFLRAGDRD
jgi:hypothetical protein